MIEIPTDNLWVCLLLFFVGLVAVIKGADVLTSGASAIARRFGVSTLLIGLTIVAFGTSLPELVVSSLASAKGSAEMAIGNVVGSNLFNTLAITGITALFCPIFCSRELLRRDIPVNIVVTALLIVFVFLVGESGVLGLAEGLGLLAIFVAYMSFTIYSSIKKRAKTSDEIDENVVPIWKSTLMIVGGLVGLIIGGDLFVDGAQGLALKMGVSESVVALTIVAAGTSFPELATSIIAARKGDTDMAMGNVVGSNIFNILLILGTASAINPIRTGNIAIVDFATLMISVVLLVFFVINTRRHCIGRVEGALLTLTMIAYYVYLVANA